MTQQLHTLPPFFAPSSVAVIGASRSRTKLGTRVLANLRQAGFRGRVFAVNPHAARILGSPAWPTVADLPLRPDLAIIATPAPTVAGLLAACGRAHIRRIIVLSAGFGESGPEGVRREAELRRITARYRLQLLGPNCLGLQHSATRLNASFDAPLAPGGNVAIVSQSGAIAVALHDWARTVGVGLRAVISLGNKAGIDEVDALAMLAGDPGVRVLVCYLESAERGAALTAQLARQTRTQHIVVLKAGGSALASRAVRLHTGALAGNAEVFRAHCTAAGAYVTTSLGACFALTAALTRVRTPPRGSRIAVVTNAGGAGILAMDAIAASTLQPARLHARTTHRLRAMLPAAAAVENPVDVLGDADPARYRNALAVVLKDPNIDSAVALLTPQVMTKPAKVAAAIVRLQRRSPLPIVAALLGGAQLQRARSILSQGGVPSFVTPEEAVHTLAAMADHANASHARGPALRGSSLRLPHATLLLPPTSSALLRRIGIPTVSERCVARLRDVPAAARRIGYPLAFKRIDPALLHKTNAGGVWVPVPNARELSRIMRIAARRFPAQQSRPGTGWLLQRYLHGGQELFLGATRDPSFGATVIVGLGGVDVELLRQTIMLAPPFTVPAIASRLRASPLLPFLTRRRGMPTVSITRLADTALRLGRLVEQHPRVLAVDVNPLLALPNGRLVAADTRVQLAP